MPLRSTYPVLISSLWWGECRKAGLSSPSSITSLSLFSLLCEIAFLINVPLPVSYKANISTPETHRSVLGNEWQLASSSCEIRASFTCSLTQAGPESQTLGYDVHRPIVHTGDLQRPLISEQVDGRRYRSRQRPSAKAKTIFPSQCVRWEGSGAAAMQQWKIWNELHRRARSHLQARHMT